MPIAYRNLLINSPEDFYKIIKSHPSLVSSNNLLTRFRDFMYLYYNGCTCNQVENYNNALEIYKTFNTLDQMVISQIKDTLSCENVVFQLSGVFIFQI